MVAVHSLVSLYIERERKDRIMEWKKSFKGEGCHNPLMTQRFGADPYALVYEGRVYIYMTGDVIERDEAGNIIENTYSIIDTINVISSDDMVNWTDHGSIFASSERGAAKWGRNSWAPAAAYKKIDGKDKFFLYFANSGNGIAVLTADSPVGPFTDPLQRPLISRETPNCADVTWLFDPAVLMDDDGQAYIYVGGGIPDEQSIALPQTARVAKLGADMISLDGDPITIDGVSYLFEDSGINKINGTYYYSYCSNFSVPSDKEEELGFGCGEIITMKSDKPMGPFEMCGSVLKNPEHFFGLGSNNHHCMFEFAGKYYMAYHTRILEDAMGISGGYRSTSIDEVTICDGIIKPIKATREGVSQIKALDPYKVQSAATMADMAGVQTIADTDGKMLVTGMENGSWIRVNGVDFGKEGAERFELALGACHGEGRVLLYLDGLEQETCIGHVDITEEDSTKTIKIELESKPVGVHDLYFGFVGNDYQIKEWFFN